MRWTFAPLLALLLLSGLPRPTAAGEPDIWFNPINHTDWLNLFVPNAPWPLAMTKVKVITLEPQWVWAATDAQILSIWNFVQQHHMRLNMDVQAVEKIPGDTCGANSEGYTWVSDIQNALAPLVRLGVHLDSIHMDEPVNFGRYETAAAGGCNLSVVTLVQRTALILNLVIAAYPDIQVVEIEPVPDLTDQPDWLTSEIGFQAGLTQLIGRQIIGMQLDVNWQNPGWPAAVSAMDRYVHEKSMKLGIFCDGLDDPGTNAGWIAIAISSCDMVESQLGIVPDQVIFGTWTNFPTNDLPETSPTTQTWLINMYQWPRSHIQASFSGQSISGQLTLDGGKPIVGATVTGYVPGVNWSAPMPVVSSIGVVPSNAVAALIGVRLNVECRCNGPNDVLLGPITYQETANGSLQGGLTIPGTDQQNGQLLITSEHVGGQPVTRIIAPPGTQLAWNSATFPVTAGASFQFSAPANSVGGDGWYGNIIVIWLDVNGNGISRIFLVPDPGRVAVSTATTDQNGDFFLPNMPRVGPGSVPVSVRYDGAGQYRASIWTP